ncbi:MAG: endonuclease III domain-containing protein [Spirochaetaceae bacterium]
MSEVAAARRDPYHVLVSTIISLRTKDQVTIAASDRLFHRAPNALSLAAMAEDEIAALIYPAGFYRTKAKNLREIARRIVGDHGGLVPDTEEGLLALPGVGRKTANLVLGLGFSIPAICVDTHVHRIPNRLGIIETKTPEQTEEALKESLPREYWIDVNGLLVAFGQQVCTPVSPRCSRCPLSAACRRVGVERSR